MNSDTKRHIDAARQVLVGVVPNPTSQIDQITYALIYKFMNDMDQSAIKNGDDPNFFTGDLEPYSWSRLMDTKIGNQERMNLYVIAFQKFAEAKQLPELFRNILKSAFLPYRSPETLGLFLKEIDYFDYSHPEELGNAYEYLLSIMSSQGDAGQFRTPRHIIDFIVDVVNPTKEDKVLDPACGTGGFLISSYKHILEQHDGKEDPSGKEKYLTPDQRRNLMNNFEGYDIDPTMVRIAQVNMYLHQFKNPKIFQYDSLSSDERWNDKFDVVLANPPFMSPKGGIKPHNKFSIQSSRSEVLFVDYIMNHLRPNGRAGIIVPEGIIFQSGGAHKQLRKNMIDDGLYAVVSLPSGVFNPYSGVKTSILFFDNEIANKTKFMLFIKVETDGFDLGAQRRPTLNNDLKQSLDILTKYKEFINTGKTSNELFLDRIKDNEKIGDTIILTHDKFSVVSRGKIEESGEYNLSGGRYHVESDYSNAKWPMIELGVILDYEQPSKYIVDSVNYSDKYSTPVLTAGKSFILGYTNEKDGIYNSELPVIIFDDFTTGTKLVNFPFKVKSSAMKILHAKEGVADIRYVYYAMQNINFVSGEHKRYWISQYSKFKIPLPPLEVQEQIVKELDGYAGIISGAKRIVTNWKPIIDIDREWEKVKLGEACEIGDGNHSSNYPKSAEMVQSGVPFIRGTNLVDGKIDTTEIKFISEGKHAQLKKGHLKANDVLFTNRGEIGKVAIVDQSFDGANLNSQIAWLRPKQNLHPIYLISILMSDYTQNQLHSLKQGATLQQFTIKQLSSFEIPIPSLGIQKRIVEKIETEREFVESAKKLIRIYEEKTKLALEKLYGHND